MARRRPDQRHPIRLNNLARPGRGHVKSAMRCLQVLEIFDTLKTELSSRTISEILGSPVSSTDYILKTMEYLGYVSYDRRIRKYSLGHRVSILGNWNNVNLTRDGPLVVLMKRMRDEFGANVVLSTKNDLVAQAIHIVWPEKDNNAIIAIGSTQPLFTRPVGFSLLSLLDDQSIADLVKRYNAANEPLVNLKDLLETVGEVRRRGFAFDTSTELGWGIALPMRDFVLDGLFAISMGAFDAEISVDPDAVQEFVGNEVRKLTAGGPGRATPEPSSR